VPTPSGVGLEPGGDSLREVHTRGVPTFGGDRGHTGGCGRVSESQAILYPQQKSESVDSSDGRSSAISPPEGIGWQDVETLVGGVCEASTSLNGGLAATRNPLPSGGGGCQRAGDTPFDRWPLVWVGEVWALAFIEFHRRLVVRSDGDLHFFHAVDAWSAGRVFCVYRPSTPGIEMRVFEGGPDFSVVLVEPGKRFPGKANSSLADQSSICSRKRLTVSSR
jgi:hypothetical protein